MRVNMRIERMRHGYTIKQVADKLDVHPNAVSRWEFGTNNPTVNNLIALCNLYECTPEYLLDMTDDRRAEAIAK
ncbi:MAG: helix-turn-helix transcriptional regulator [Bacteroidales bacterium]|nr:helix-turn-helix transcriptional regulator [Bacteroidales bacterium]